jgi:hypothetical protein
LRALICGPRSYPWYAWGRRLSLLALLAFALLASACSDLETSAYRILAVTQAEYETVQDKVAESAARNLITEQQWERFQVLGHRFIAAHNSAVDAFTLWSKTKQPADTARLQAMLDLLPSLVVDINALVDSFSTPPNTSPGHSPNGATVPPPAGPSVQPQLDQPLDAAPSSARVAFRIGSHGELVPSEVEGRLSHRGFVPSFAVRPASESGILNLELVPDLGFGIWNFPSPVHQTPNRCHPEERQRRGICFSPAF